MGTCGQLVPALANPPAGPAIDVVLICHVAAAVVGLGAVVVSGVEARRLHAARSVDLVSDSVRRYYAQGTNWAGRVLFLVPVFGATLVALSPHRYDLADAWLLGGIVLWVVAASVAEGALWPLERRLQRMLAQPPAEAGAVTRTCRLVLVSSSAVSVMLLSAIVLMVARPS